MSDKITQEIEALADRLEKSQEVPEVTLDMIKERVLELGPEELKALVPTLNDNQKILLKSILEEVKTEVGEPLEKAAELEVGVDDEEEERKKKAKKQTSEDEALVKESNKDVKPQGDDSVQSGEVIKSVKKLSKSEFRSVVERMIETGVEKIKAVAALAKSLGAEEAQVESVWDAMEKAFGAKGEGSKGGHIVGHTKSGKPIYQGAFHPEHASFTKQDHSDAHKLKMKMSDEADKKAGIMGSEEGDKHFVDAEAHKEAAKKMSKKPSVDHFKDMSWSEHRAAMEKHPEDSHMAKFHLSMANARLNKDKLDSPYASVRSSAGKKMLREDMGKHKEDAKMHLKNAIEAGEATKPESKPGLYAVKKSFDENEARDPFATRNIGHNCHYDVDSYIAKSHEDQEARLAKSTFNYDDSDSLRKSSDVNDLIEKSQDTTECAIISGNIEKARVTGGFMIKSFSDEDMDAVLGISKKEESGDEADLGKFEKGGPGSGKKKGALSSRIHIHEGDKLVGKLEPEQLREHVQGSRNGFVQDHVDKFNKYHESIGSNRRASLVFERGGKDIFAKSEEENV